jgi:hypothetical protein
MRIFVESRIFTWRIKEFLDERGYRAFQNELLTNPHKGRVMPGCSGLRKVRFEDQGRGQGKRGGCRIIYLDIPEAGRIDLIAVYGKNEKDDLSAQEKKVLAVLARQAKAEAIATHGKKVK